MSDDLELERTAAELFDVALGLSGDERVGFLDERAGVDSPLRKRVDRLLALSSSRTPAGLAPPARGIALVPELATGAMLGGRFRVLEEIGAGGLGIVYRAEQLEPVKRRVAVKVLRPGLADPRILARFDAELSVLALLSHPHIAQVIDGGRAVDGRPFIAMELVEGVPLSQYVDGKDLEARLHLFVTICRAVHHAHQKGVVHRDLKPSNILVVDLDGTGAPKIIDFGVARVTGDALPRDQTLTAAGEPIGTPTYMSPEQAGIGSATADARSDIYSLGVVLYELLTGVVPFGPETLPRWGWLELQKALAQSEPVRPSLMLARRLAAGQSTPSLGSQSFAGDLDAVVGMALSKSPDARYPSASELAAEVERVLRGEPVLARPPSAGDRLWRFVRRHRLAVTAGVVAFLAIAIAAVAIGVMAIQRASEESIARADAEASERIRARGALRAADAALAMGDGSAARANLASIPSAYRGWEWDFRMGQSETGLATLAQGPLTTRVSLRGGVVASGGDNGELRAWDAASYAPLARVRPFETAVAGMLLSADGRTLVAAYPTALVAIDTRDGTERWRRAGRFTVENAALSRDGRTFLVGSDEPRAIQLRRIGDGELERSIPVSAELARIPQWLDDERIVYTDQIRAIIITRDGREVARVQALLVSSYPELHRFVGRPGPLYGRPALYDADGRELLRPSWEPFGMDIDPRTGNILAQRFANVVEIRTPDGAQALQRLIGASGIMSGSNIGADEPLMVTGDSSGAVRLWSSLPAPVPFINDGTAELPWSAAFDVRRNRVVVGGWGVIQAYDATTGAELWMRALSRAYVGAIALDHAGERIVVVDLRGGIVLLDADHGHALATWHPFADRIGINAVAWSSDDGSLALGLGERVGGRGALARFDIARGVLVERIDVQSSRVRAVAFDVSGTMLATGGGYGDDWPQSGWRSDVTRSDTDTKLRLWAWPSLVPLGAFEGHSAPIRSLVWSPIGPQLVSTAADGTVRLWDMPSGLVQVRRAAGGVAGAAFSADGRRFFTAQESRQVAVWDASDAELLTFLDAGETTLTGIALMADGALVGSSKGNPVVRFEPPPSQALRMARAASASARAACDTFTADYPNSVAARLASSDAECRAILQRHGDNPNRLNSRAWAAVMRPGGSIEALVRAEQDAEAAIAIMPDADFWHTLALAHVRTGRYAAALVALDEAVAQRGASDPIDEPVRAMALAGLGDFRCRDAVAAGLAGVDPAIEDLWILQLEGEAACDDL